MDGEVIRRGFVVMLLSSLRDVDCVVACTTRIEETRTPGEMERHEADGEVVLAVTQSCRVGQIGETRV